MAALGYSVFPILKLLGKLKLVKWDSGAVSETISLLKRLGEKKLGARPLDFDSRISRRAQHSHDVAFGGS